MNRTLSCTVGEEKLIKAFAFLGRCRLNAPTLASIARMCIELVAQQLESEPTTEESEQFQMLANGVGRVSGQVKLQVSKFSVMQQQSVGKQQLQSTPTTAWWQELGCCSAQEAEEYTQFLREQGLTRSECSYSDWHLRKAGVGPELEAQAHERGQRLRREQEEMAQIVEQMKGVNNKC